MFGILYIIVLILNRVFGRLALIPFIEGERCPNGIEAQQRAEHVCENLLDRASAALGTMVGVSEDINYIFDTRTKSIRAAMEQDVTNLDDRCMKNYALLISLAEKLGLLSTHRPGHLASSPCKSVTKTADYYAIVFVKFFLFLVIFIPKT